MVAFKNKSVKCAFHRATKLYIEHYLGGVESIPYPLGEGGIGHYSLFPENDKQQIDGKNLKYEKGLGFISKSCDCNYWSIPRIDYKTKYS